MDLFLISLGANVVTLLWGLRMIRKAVNKAYGNFLHEFIRKNSAHKFKSILAGFSTTLLLQSSGATAMIIASLASQNILNTTTGIGMLLGADLGTAVIAQFLALKITWLSPVLLISGYFLYKTSKAPKGTSLGKILIGIGFILLALHLISELTDSLKSSKELVLIFGSLEHERLMAFIFGVIMTWVFHSSLATILLVSGLALSGVISLNLALIFVLGANVGSGLIPLLINLKENAKAKRILFANFAVRTVFAIFCLIFIPQITNFVGSLGKTLATQVLNFHLLFNVILLILCYPFISLLSKTVTKLISEQNQQVDIYAPRYLHSDGFKNTTIGLSNATRETIRMGELVERMLRYTKRYFETNDPTDHYDKISVLDDQVDELYKGIRDYLVRIGQQELSEQDSMRHDELMSYTINLEHAGDLIESSLLALVQQKNSIGIKFSDEGYNEIIALYARLLNNFQTAASLLMQPNRLGARELIQNKSNFSLATRKATESHIERLKAGNATSISSSTLHLDILRDFRQINSHICSVAYPILEGTGDLYKNRLRSTKKNKKVSP